VTSDELSLGEIQEIMSGAVPDRPAIRWRGTTVTHRDLTRRSRLVANLLVERGLGNVTERSQLEPWQSGQDFVGVYLRNRPEYLEAILASFKARCVPFNINYRYRADEIGQLFTEAPPKALFYEADLAGIVAELQPGLPPGIVLIEVTSSLPDAPGGASLSGAVAYDEVVRSGQASPVPVVASPDDLYVVFTGGTTGQPKAVMWRQADAVVSALHGPSKSASDPRPTRDAIVDELSPPNRIVLPAAPFMHGGGQWTALGNLLNGATVVIQDVVHRLEPADIWSTVERERVSLLMITGNAYGVPLVDELARAAYDLRSLRVILTGAVAMTDDVKSSLLRSLPGVRIVETIGASESGTHLQSSTKDPQATPTVYEPSPDTVVLNEDRSAYLQPGDPEPGWLARVGQIPLGYLGDRERTEATFPSLNGVRHAVVGDRALLLADGRIEFLGRESATINSGGEKIFNEEVEKAIASFPEVYDVVVTGRDHPRWGQEVVALVQLRPGALLDADQLKERVSQRLARYKVPRRVVFVDEIPRSHVGKADYVWARARAAALSPAGEAPDGDT
jgi:acyl-CoA synthetase (AMP-forming)/AMP-acid ligase II